MAELVVDQATGDTLSAGALPAVDTALPLGQGLIERTTSAPDRLGSLRWLYGAALLTGIGTAAVLMAVDYVKQRRQFGRSLASFQAVQFRLAESILKLDAARLMVLDAARHADAADKLADVTAALAWIYVAEVAPHIEAHTHQVFGAMGFTEEMGLIRLTYQSTWLRTSVGTEAAVTLVNARRAVGSGTPASVVLDGFGDG